MNLNDNLDQTRIKLSNAFKSIGFSEQDIQTQLNQLSELISISVLAEIVNQYPEDKERIMQATDDFIAENFTPEEFLKISNEVTAKVTTSYLSNITEGLSTEKKAAFLELMAS